MPEMWDKIPKETAKAWAAFQIYRDLPPHSVDGEPHRTLPNAAKGIGHKSTTMVAEWSRKFAWGERTRAYDAHLGTLALTFHEVEIERYQQHVVESTMQQITVLDKVLNKRLKAAGVETTAIDLLRLAKGIETLDNLKRRIGRMPTTYRASNAEDSPDDAMFIVGESS